MSGGDAATESAPAGGSVLRNWLPVYLKGLAMGTADAIPGVSGGTIALIVGIYDRLVDAIAALEPRGLLDALLSPESGRARAVRDELVAMDVHFLVVLGLGAVTGIATVAQVLELVLHEFPVPTFGFFFGLIAASAVVLYSEVSVDTPFRVLVGLVGVVTAYYLAGEFSAGVGQSLPVVALTGMVVISAMLLPGVSGSFLLLALGQLTFMTEHLNDFLEGLLALATGGGVARVVDSGSVVAAFALGAGVGLLTIARVVRYALDRNRPATLTFLVSLMVGGLRVPGREVYANAGSTGDWMLAVGVALVGAALVIGLDRATGEIGVAE